MMTLLEILALTVQQLQDILPNLSPEELKEWLKILKANKRSSGEYQTTVLLVKKEYRKRVDPDWAYDAAHNGTPAPEIEWV